MMPETRFDPRIIEDIALKNLRELALKTVTETSPTFGEWLRKWCETEQYWRTTNPDHRPVKHAIALPPVHTWTNKELGQALRAVSVLSYIEQSEPVGSFVDRATLCVVEEAASRLTKDE